MPIIARQPENKNFLSVLGFSFFMKRAPGVMYFGQKYELPGLLMGVANYPSTITDIPLPGDRLRRSDFTMTFKVDEDLRNYLEIFDWMEGLGSPINTNQYANLNSHSIMSGEGIMCDATLMINTSAHNPNIQITLEDIWPVSLTGFQMVSTSGDVQQIEATVSFKIRHHKFEYAANAVGTSSFNS